MKKNILGHTLRSDGIIGKQLLRGNIGLEEEAAKEHLEDRAEKRSVTNGLQVQLEENGGRGSNRRQS